MYATDAIRSGRVGTARLEALGLTVMGSNSRVVRKGRSACKAWRLRVSSAGISAREATEAMEIRG